MAHARCKNGHIYDSELYGDRCPYCEHSMSTIYFDSDFQSQDGSRFSLAQEAIPKTMPAVDFQVPPEKLGETVGVFVKHHQTDPVVGWLVCVKGHDYGQDFKLRAKTNLIGRGAEMDLCIQGDDTITSDTHAKIDYDILNNAFYLLPGNNRNTIYVNKSPVYTAQKLNAYDRLRFGETELLFVPFCNELFTWPKSGE